jgi:hypothetical protein
VSEKSAEPEYEKFDPVTGVHVFEAALVAKLSTSNFVD